MCCTVVAWMLLIPRVSILAWNLYNPAYVNAAFDNFFWGLVGWLLAPWTSLFFIGLYPGGIVGSEWLWLGMGFLADLATYFGGYFSGGPVIYIAVTPTMAEDEHQQ